MDINNDYDYNNWLMKLTPGDRVIHKLSETKHEKGIRMWKERVENVIYHQESKQMAIEVWPDRYFSQNTGYNIYSKGEDLTRWITPEGKEEKKYFLYEDILPDLKEAEYLISTIRKYLNDKKLEDMDYDTLYWVKNTLQSISREEIYSYASYKELCSIYKEGEVC